MSEKHAYYQRGMRVRVIVPGERYKHVGVVASSFNDAGDMVHRVKFPDGALDLYATEELRSADVGNRWGS